MPNEEVVRQLVTRALEGLEASGASASDPAPAPNPTPAADAPVTPAAAGPRKTQQRNERMTKRGPGEPMASVDRIRDGEAAEDGVERGTPPLR